MHSNWRWKFGTNVEKLSMIGKATTFFVTLMNCDLNMYSHIPYKPLENCDYRPKKNLQNN
jgi:hypothetical protein